VVEAIWASVVATSNCVLMGKTMAAEDRGEQHKWMASLESARAQQDAADSATQNPRCHKSREG
jgi:hypothetical protein